MGEIHPIVSVVGRARRRLQVQRALEWAVVAATAAVAGELVVLWTWRMRVVGSDAAVWAALAVAAVVPVVALIGGRAAIWSTEIVAARLDRASGLSDRLGTAWDFAGRLGRLGPRGRLGADGGMHPDTRALMVAAIEDGVRAAERADVKGAAPLRAPRDLRALAAFGGVAAVIVALTFGASTERGGERAIAPWPAGSVCEANAPVERSTGAELSHVRVEVADLRTEVEEQGDALSPALDRIDALLAAAERGELSKGELLEAVDAVLADVKGARSGRLADIRDLIRHTPPAPPPPVTPPPAPPPPTGPTQPPGPDDCVCAGDGVVEHQPDLPANNSIGHGQDPELFGPETARLGETHDEDLAGVDGEGESRRKTIQAAAQHGFAARAYARVYAEYRSVVEEVLVSERVPQGYRTAVKLYFARIHPGD